MKCRICHLNEVPDERVEIGYTHCKSRECVAAWKRERLTDNELKLVLVPKVGMQWVTKENAKENNRASGK